jgi:cell division initiation protein
MKLSSGNIKEAEFSNSLRGFNKKEVRVFLIRLSEDVAKLQKENEELRVKFEQANKQLSEFKKLEKNIQDTLAKAEETSSRSIEAAKKKTNFIIQEAELRAQQILEKARENVNDVRNSLVQLREERTLIIAKLKAIINSQAHLLEMKVEENVQEKETDKPVEKISKVDIDADDIADKL